MFGMHEHNASSTGDQIKGFGYMHDGSMDTLDNFFHSTSVFTFDINSTATRKQVVDFVIASDSNHAPIIGQQITLSSSSPTAVSDRVDLLVTQANAGNSDLIAKYVESNTQRGAYMASANTFILDRNTDVNLNLANLKLKANQLNGEVTFSCAPLGTGERLGIDRDLDGVLDGDE